MTRDRGSYDLFGPPQRTRFGDSELADDKVVKSNLCDLDLILHNDNPNKQAIAVSLAGNTPFERWVWLPRSVIEYERTGIGVNNSALVRVTLPENIAKNKGLV
jgi:hypothetical protein